jgi:hypothetical protein
MVAAGVARAQSISGSHGGQSGGEAPPAAAEPKMPDIKPLPPPAQRLEAGALLCDSQDELVQHQRAVAARLAGGFAPEPTGCHIMRDMIAVTLLMRNGLAATEVRVAGKVGWTDSHVRDAK